MAAASAASTLSSAATIKVAKLPAVAALISTASPTGGVEIAPIAQKGSMVDLVGVSLTALALIGFVFLVTAAAMRAYVRSYNRAEEDEEGGKGVEEVVSD